METAIITSLIAGFFSLATALASVWLKHHLETRTPTPPPFQSGSPQTTLTAGSPTFGSISSRAALLVMLGFLLGAASRLARGGMSGPIHYEAIASLALLVGTSCTLAFHHRKHGRRLWLYELDAFSLWAAFESGWSLLNRGLWTDALVTFGAWWLGCAMLGGVFVLVGRRSAA